MREEDLAMAKILVAESMESPTPLRKAVNCEERTKAFAR